MKIEDEFLEPFSITIDSDNFCLAIEKEYEKPNGEKYAVKNNESYHSNLDSLFNKLIKHKLSNDERVFNLQQFLAEYKRLNTLLIAKFADLKKLPTNKTED